MLKMLILCIFASTFKQTFVMDITVQELKERIDEGQALIMIDVREPHEWAMDHLEGVKKISLGALPSQLPDLGDLKDKEVIMICRSGGRSGKATAFMQSQGFEHARNLAGGMLAWKAAIDPGFNVQ